jgi:CheY-like chemotaxis protein
LQQGPRFDVAILDLQMPGMDGVHLAREIHALEGFKELPLILLSSSLPSRSTGTAPGDEFCVRLMKPIKQADLFNALTTAIGNIKTITKSLRPARVFDPAMAQRLPFRILIVEDNPINQKVAGRTLLQFGYQTDVANDGSEAIRVLESQHYDIVFMDLQMPIMGGLDATRAIRERVDMPQPYIIAMTANAMQEDRDACRDCGMDDYLSKPIRAEEIKGALERAAARAESHDLEAPDNLLIPKRERAA